MLYVSEFLGLISVTYVWIWVCEVQKGTKFYVWLGLEPEMVKTVERKSRDSKKKKLRRHKSVLESNRSSRGRNKNPGNDMG